eukprot:2586970-Rhodomonas_salina.1
MCTLPHVTHVTLAQYRLAQYRLFTCSQYRCVTFSRYTCVLSYYMCALPCALSCNTAVLPWALSYHTSTVPACTPVPHFSASLRASSVPSA